MRWNWADVKWLTIFLTHLKSPEEPLIYYCQFLLLTFYCRYFRSGRFLQNRTSGNKRSRHFRCDVPLTSVPARHKIGHFGDVPQANLLAWYGKTKPNTKKHTFSNQKKCTTQKLMPGLVASYDIQPRKREGLFWFRHFTTFVTCLLT